ncbi:MAG: hypothetical protein ACRERX_21295, partial [Pseudomonas sp.]
MMRPTKQYGRWKDELFAARQAYRRWSLRTGRAGTLAALVLTAGLVGGQTGCELCAPSDPNCAKPEWSVSVETTTKGSNLDPDGYSVNVNGVIKSIGINERIEAGDFREGTRIS